MPVGAAEESASFVPGDFMPPTRLDHPQFRLRPLGPEHNERDHAAWTASVDHIQTTPGFSPEWFYEPITLDENLADLRSHQQDFSDKTGFTYTVLDPLGPAGSAEVIGCVYIYPDDHDDVDVDVEILSWVRADHASLDPVVARTVRAWLEEAWPWSPDRIHAHPRRPEA